MIDTKNMQAVGINGDYIVVLKPKRSMTIKESYFHAAWLVSMAAACEGESIDGALERFSAALRAIEGP